MNQAAEKSNNQKLRQRLLLLLGLIAAGSLLAGAYWFFVLRYQVTTDNAYVMADSASISCRVPGTVTRVLVENDEPVRRGQVLLELDPRDYRAAMQEAEGALARIEAEIKGLEVSVTLTDTQTAAQVQAAKARLQEARERKLEALHRLKELQKKRLVRRADLRKAERDFRRFDSLFRSGAVSEHQRDRMHTALVKARAELEAIDAEFAALRASLQAVNQEVIRARANLKAAGSDRSQVQIQRQRLAALQARKQEKEAALQAARLNLSYCTIAAPIAGYIAHKNVQVGDRVRPGQPLMAVVPLQNVYVEANFKETQLEHVRLGQKATIRADMYPHHTYHGRVAGIRAGTGAAFSLLPPENATGNWIKVVQRVPVKIELDSPPPSEHPLRVGLSLKVTIHTRDQRGRVLISRSSGP